MRKGWGHGEDGQDREVHGRGSLFRLGIACIVIATVSLYIAGMLRDRRIQAEFARRHAERERRRAERENRGW